MANFVCILRFWVVLAMAVGATNTSAAQDKTQDTEQTNSPVSPPSAGGEVFLGFLSASALNDEAVQFFYLDLGVVYEDADLWIEGASTGILFMLVDVVGLLFEFIAGDFDPELPLGEGMNGEDTKIFALMFTELNVRGAVAGQGRHIWEVGGLFSTEVFISDDTEVDPSAVNGATLAPTFGYRYFGEMFRASAAVFVGPRFDYDSLDGAALGVETMLRLAPVVGFGGYVKGRGQMLLLADADNQGNSGAIPMVFAEIGVLYRWKD